MKKYSGTRYSSRWDVSTWLIIFIISACCIIPAFLDDGFGPIVIAIVMMIFVLTTFISISYRIDGDQLIVYTFFIPREYPIDKIREISHTKSTISAPATSLKHRLAITFTDRHILNQSAPLIISPTRAGDFIRQLKEINPGILTSSK